MGIRGAPGLVWEWPRPLGFTRLRKSLLLGVVALEMATLTASAIALLGIVPLAATRPALHAALTDPASVLGRE